MSNPLRPEEVVPDSTMLLLLQRLSDSQVEQGRTQSKLAQDQHDIKLALATLTAELKPLTSVASEISALSLSSHRHSDRLDSHAVEIRALREDVDDLQTDNDKRTGWETPGGKLLYLVGGALIAAITAYFTSGGAA